MSEEQARGFGTHIGINDRLGRPIRIGDVLEFDAKEWGSPLTFQVTLKDGEISHPGTTRDLSEWCTIVSRLEETDHPAIKALRDIARGAPVGHPYATPEETLAEKVEIAESALTLLVPEVAP